MNPYYLMALLYMALATLAALDTSLVNLQILPYFPGQRWLLVHSVTLGALVELVFGLAPDLIIAITRLRKDPLKQLRPTFQWPQWFLLNSGLIILYAGIPPINASLIIGGGTLIFLAASLLIKQLLNLVGQRSEASSIPSEKRGEKFASSQGPGFTWQAYPICS